MPIKLVKDNGKINLSGSNGNVELKAPAGGKVKSVNGMVGNVVLTAKDVKALPEDTVIPSIEGLASEGYVNEAVANVKVDLTGYATEVYVNDAIAEKHSDLVYLQDLINTDMLPSFHNGEGKLLIDSNNQIILRF